MNANNIGDMLQVIEILAPARKIASENGAAIDLQQYVGDLKLVLSASAGGGTTPTLDIKLQESDTAGGAFTDIPSGAFAQVAATSSTQSITIDADARKRFIRAITTITGTSPTFDLALVALGLLGRY